MLSLLAQSFIDQSEGVSCRTNSKQLGAFDRWRQFIEGCGLQDEFLDKFTKKERTCILSAFATSVRRNEYGKTNKTQLCKGTVSSTISHVCTTFRTNLRNDPSLEESGIKSIFLQRQMKGYKDGDPGIKHQKALPLLVFRTMKRDKLLKINVAIAQLCEGAFFFAMRSCEYSTVVGPRKMTLVCI